MNKKTDPRLLWTIGLSGAVMALWLTLLPGPSSNTPRLAHGIDTIPSG